MRVSSQVPKGVQDQPIVAYLAERFTYLPAEAWRQMVLNGRTWRNDLLCHEETLVQAGDRITCELPDFPAPEVNLDYELVYEDPWLLGINKPPNLRVHSQGKFVTANLIYHLRHQRQPPYPEAQLVHRLDANTSGVMVVARRPEVQQALGTQFAAGEVEKVYLAVVAGVPNPPVGVIDLPLGKAFGSPWRHKQAVVAGGKMAVTSYKTIATYQPGYALLELRPRTGRTHQLRVHLAAAGHPIVGDALYTMGDAAFMRWLKDPRPTPEMQGMTRHALHAQEVRFAHPVSGEACVVTASFPKDMQALVTRLEEATGKVII